MPGFAILHAQDGLGLAARRLADLRAEAQAARLATRRRQGPRLGGLRAALARRRAARPSSGSRSAISHA